VIASTKEVYFNQEQISSSPNTVTASEMPKYTRNLHETCVIGGLEVFLGRSCESTMVRIFEVIVKTCHGPKEKGI
jgi:hypothetical protein